MAGYIGNAPVPQATQTRDNFTATAGQTSFATSGYTPGYLDVYLNGVRLDESDYTATNGSDVVLDTGAAVDDVVSVVAFQTFEVAGDEFTLTDITAQDSNGIQFNTDEGTERVRIDDSGNVGIGTNSPDSPLNIHNSSAPRLRIGYSSSQYHDIAWDSSKLVLKADPSNQRPNSALMFEVDGTERMRIDSLGKLLVGKSSGGNTNTPGFEVQQSGFVGICGDNFRPVQINRQTSDGDIIEFRKNGTTVGSIGSEGGDSLFIQGGTSSGAGLLCHGGAGKVLPVRNGTSIDNAIDLGQDSRRFKDIYAAGELNFSNAVATNGYDINKITLWESGSNKYGFGISGSQLNYITDAHHVFYEDANERMRINSGGAVTIPNQPAFSITSSSADVALTASSGTPTALFNSKKFDIGGNFNTSTYRFTAPVAGRYYFSIAIQADNSSSGAHQHALGVFLRKNGTTYSERYQGRSGSGDYITITNSDIIDLAANDYVDVAIRPHTNISIEYSGGTDRCKFSGFLIG